MLCTTNDKTKINVQFRVLLSWAVRAKITITSLMMHNSVGWPKGAKKTTQHSAHEVVPPNKYKLFTELDVHFCSVHFFPTIKTTKWNCQIIWLILFYYFLFILLPLWGSTAHWPTFVKWSWTCGQWSKRAGPVVFIYLGHLIFYPVDTFGSLAHWYDVNLHLIWAQTQESLQWKLLRPTVDILFKKKKKIHLEQREPDQETKKNKKVKEQKISSNM